MEKCTCRTFVGIRWTDLHEMHNTVLTHNQWYIILLILFANTLLLSLVTRSMENGLQIEKKFFFKIADCFRVVFKQRWSGNDRLDTGVHCSAQFTLPLCLLLVWSPGNKIQSPRSSHLPQLPSIPTIETYASMIALGHIDLNFSFDPNVLSEYLLIPMQINVYWN